MTLTETMAVIEQEKFAAEMNLAAGTKAFRRAIREHELFHRLSPNLRKNTLPKSQSASKRSRVSKSMNDTKTASTRP
jgi:hypothetical protein